MSNKYFQATSNLAMLEIIARRLEELNNEVVYLGGCTTALFINDPLSSDVRSTLDVDCIIDVISLGEYNKFSKRLEKKGFKQSIKDDIICRWHHDEIILDVMPLNDKILGFGNSWYKEALEHSIPHKIADDVMIKSVTAPYFIATKIEAFKGRGNNDFLKSHDLEDVINVISGRTTIADEVLLATDQLKAYIRDFFENMLSNEQFLVALPGHLNEGPTTMQRVQIVIARIKKMIGSNNE